MGGKVTSVEDKVRKVVSSYTYDDNVDNLTQIKTEKTENNITKVDNTEDYEYNDYGAISKITYSGEVTRTVKYTYEDTSKMRLTTLYNGAHFVEYGYDSLGRNNNKIVKVNNVEVCKQTIAYTAGLNCTTTMPSKISYNDGSSIAYTYDELSNIKKIAANNKSIDYTYDSSDRLIREDNGEHGRSYFYTYDNNGNITKKETCMYNTGSDKVGTVTVVNYAYNGNKLTSFNGERCTYDNIGNPTIYRGNIATWKGRQLQFYNGITFVYDGRGRRIRKGAQRYYYDYADRLIRDDNLYYFYDHIGVAGFRYNGTYYTYKRDVQNNVIAILDNNGNIVVQYRYDAWGNHTIFGSNVTLGNLNPFRYRSYFYDNETGLYYLKTRYYDPAVGRFLNMDSVDYADPEATDGLNLYVYCGNNPVMNVDPTGHFAISTFIFSLAIGLLFSWGISEICGEHVAGGISSTVGGGVAVSTGISLLSFGPVGWIAGITLILIGAGTIVFGVNEVVAGVTGTNYIQTWTGMSDGLYNGIYIGLNIASMIGSIAGNLYMDYANVSGSRAGTTGKPLSRYSTIDDNGVKQYRFYDSNGNAWFDKDFRHSGPKLRFPHYHGWVNGTKLSGHWSFLELLKFLFMGIR